MGDHDVQSCPTLPRAAEHGGGAAAEEDAAALRLLDSLDGYLILLDSLSSTLRQGWFELASARHSMGSSRISSALFDLKAQSAATTLQMRQLSEGSPLGIALVMSEPHFALSKWASLRDGDRSPRETELEVLQKKSDSSQLRHRGPSHNPDDVRENNRTATEPPLTTDSSVQRERSKSLAVFGTLVSPKLRASQISFEKALETIVEIANLRSMALSAYSQLQLEK